MKCLSLLVLLGTLAAGATQAVAGDVRYKASDIVAFFEDQKQLLVTRGICVGSDEECAAEQVKDHASAFDLLVNFDKDSAILTEEARSNLIEFSIALRDSKLGSLRFAVDGFTDASGSEAHNLDLSKRRSQAVIAFLGGLGVEADRLEARGWGESNFRAADAFDATNRRVETRLLR
jgi:OmpA-OmpF porin, OOP family